MNPIKSKGRNHKRRAYAVHHDVARHDRWVQLSVHAKLLWFELGLEYYSASRDLKKSGNNGWLALPYRYLIEKRGFQSRSTIKEAFDELEWFGFIETTYPGSFPKEPARYRLTHLDSDTHPDHNVPAKKATYDYRKHDGTPFPKRSRKKTTATVPLATPLVPPNGPMKSNAETPSPARGELGETSQNSRFHG